MLPLDPEFPRDTKQMLAIFEGIQFFGKEHLCKRAEVEINRVTLPC